MKRHEAIMTATLEVTDLRKQFAIGRPAIDGVSFAVPAGEIVVLLGPSGCGKTTTLRCVAGLEHPTIGRNQHRRAGWCRRPSAAFWCRRASRDLGMVFQSYAVWPHMTVRQNVVYPLKHRKIARGEAGARSTRCWSWSACPNMPTGRWWRCPAARCSASRWRAASSTGRNCCCSTSPCRTSMPNCACGCATILRVILKQTGMTALYVTHDQAEAVVLGDRIGVMRDGKLLQMDTPDEIYNRPADLFVANFTGATNELAGTLVERNGEFGVVDFGDGRRGEVALLHALGAGRKGAHRAAAGKHRDRQAGRRQHFFPRACSTAAIRARRQSTTSNCSAGGWKCSNSAPRPGIRSGVETPVCLPREGCWAYRDTGPSSYE